MADYPNPSEAGSQTFERENYEDYSGAINAIRAARSIFVLLLVLSLLTHAGAYSMARWTDVLNGPGAAAADVTTPAAGEESAAENSVRQAERALAAIELGLPLTEFIGQVSCVALLLCYLLGANICLSGRLGGVRGSIAAFFWMLVLLALVFPWDRWLGPLRGQVQVPGVYLTSGEVESIPTGFASQIAEILHYVRFLGYPLLVFLIAIVADRRCARGFRLAQRQVEARLSVRGR